MAGEIRSHIGQLLDPPPNYRELDSNEVVLDSDMEGDPRGFIGWKQARPEIRNKPFCKCWGIQVIRAL